MCKIFKRNSLQITIEANKKVVDFLDITLDLRTEIYTPYKKPNSNLTFIHKQSNHPHSIIKNLPKSINKHLSTNSKNAQVFNEACIYVSRWIAVFLCFHLIALVFPIFPFYWRLFPFDYVDAPTPSDRSV